MSRKRTWRRDLTGYQVELVAFDVGEGRPAVLIELQVAELLISIFPFTGGVRYAGVRRAWRGRRMFDRSSLDIRSRSASRPSCGSRRRRGNPRCDCTFGRPGQSDTGSKTSKVARSSTA